MRLARTAYGFRFGYDGLALVEEHSGGGREARYVHGPGIDEPLVWYDQANTRRYLHADERGSIVAISQDGGSTYPGGQPWQFNEYDDYGRPHAGNLGRFGYTGQLWLPEHGLWYYKARMYSPTLGRFMQTDPIGYWAGMNLYGYVSGDPVNFSDPLGLTEEVPVPDYDGPTVVVCAGEWREGRCVRGWVDYPEGVYLLSYQSSQPETIRPDPYPSTGEEAVRGVIEGVRDNVRRAASSSRSFLKKFFQDILCPAPGSEVSSQEVREAANDRGDLLRAAADGLARSRISVQSNPALEVGRRSLLNSGNSIIEQFCRG